MDSITANQPDLRVTALPGPGRLSHRLIAAVLLAIGLGAPLQPAAASAPHRQDQAGPSFFAPLPGRAWEFPGMPGVPDRAVWLRAFQAIDTSEHIAARTSAPHNAADLTDAVVASTDLHVSPRIMGAEDAPEVAWGMMDLDLMQSDDSAYRAETEWTEVTSVRESSRAGAGNGVAFAAAEGMVAAALAAGALWLGSWLPLLSRRLLALRGA